MLDTETGSLQKQCPRCGVIYNITKKTIDKRMAQDNFDSYDAWLCQDCKPDWVRKGRVSNEEIWDAYVADMIRKKNKQPKQPCYVPPSALENAAKANKERSEKVAREKAEFFSNLNQKYIDLLPENMKKLVVLRIQNPTASLTEIGLLSEPRLSKDQVAGKMRRAIAIIKGEQE